MKNYSSLEVIRILRQDGWYEYGCEGSHRQFRHQTKKGKVTVTHPQKTIPIKTFKSIMQQAGIVIPKGGF